MQNTITPSLYYYYSKQKRAFLELLFLLQMSYVNESKLICTSCLIPSHQKWKTT